MGLRTGAKDGQWSPEKGTEEHSLLDVVKILRKDSTPDSSLSTAIGSGCFYSDGTAAQVKLMNSPQRSEPTPMGSDACCPQARFKGFREAS